MNYRVITLIWAFFFCLSMASAQPEETIRFSFSVYGLRPGDYSRIYYRDARGEPVKLTFHRKRRSERYEAEVLAEAAALKFLRKVIAGDRNKESGYREISTVRLSQEPDRLLFVFVPRKNSDEEEPYRILPVADNQSAGQGGTVRIINLTGLTLLGMVEGERFELPSLSTSKPFRATREGQSDFSIVAEGTSRYHLVYRNSFSIDSESRAILFLTPPYRKVSLKLGGQMLYQEVTPDTSSTGG